MKKSLAIPAIFAAFMVGLLLGIFGSNTPVRASTTSDDQPAVEVCKVIKHEQVIHSARGSIRVAILQRGNGELRTLYLHPFSGREDISPQAIPAECELVYASWPDRMPNLEVGSVVPLYPKEGQ